MGQFPVLLGFVFRKFWPLQYYCSPYPLSCSILVAKLQLCVPAVAATSKRAALNWITLLVDEWERNWHPLSTYLRDRWLHGSPSSSCCDCCSNHDWLSRFCSWVVHVKGLLKACSCIGMKDWQIDLQAVHLSMTGNLTQRGQMFILISTCDSW